MLSYLKQDKRRAILPLTTLIALVFVIVAIATPWGTGESSLTIAKKTMGETEYSATLWSTTTIETDYSKSKKGKIKTTTVKHSKSCRSRKSMSDEADDNCDRFMSSQGLVISAFVFGIAAVGSYFGLTFFALQKQQHMWFTMAKWIPVALLGLSALLILSAWAQWPGIVSNFETIMEEVKEKSKDFLKTKGNEISYDISLSTGFAMSIIANLLLIAAAVAGFLFPVDLANDMLPQTAYAAAK